jgi:phosphatidyl-myo-inositol dimannoside synthase
LCCGAPGQCRCSCGPGCYRKPYAVEVLGDYREVFRVIQHPLRPLLRMGFSLSAERIVRNASAVLYVSKALERNYPARSGTASTVASDVRLDARWFGQPRDYTQVRTPLRISHVGNMDLEYKGHEYLLKALAICRDRGLPVSADLIGEGRLRGRFQEQARILGLGGHVKFHGTVAWGPDVFALLDRSDLFVFCSLSEGLGKALLEAMARGLPAVGTNVGGIPELLAPEVLVGAGDAEGLARKIVEVASDGNTMARLSRANHAKALQYRLEVLEQKRLGFYRDVRRALGG